MLMQSTAFSHFTICKKCRALVSGFMGLCEARTTATDRRFVKGHSEKVLGAARHDLHQSTDRSG
jgi:hypothetical protein